MSVGYKLYRQIRDYAPADWTSGELVVALMIADSANEQTRRSYITAADLAKLSRMTGDGVRKNLQKLAGKGFEFRVTHGKDTHGNPLYAVAGNGVEYQVPDIFGALQRASAVAFGLVDKLADEALEAGLSTDPGGTTVPASRDHSTGSPLRALSSFDLKTSSKPPQPPGDRPTHLHLEPRARDPRYPQENPDGSIRSTKPGRQMARTVRRMATRHQAHR